jgi:(S)-2-hydroxy-acid oxidase
MKHSGRKEGNMIADAVLTLADLEQLALQKVDKITRDYWSNGAGENLTIRENALAFDQYRIRPRVLRNVRDIDMSTAVLGNRVNIPVGIAPSGWHRMAHPDGEAATARAALALGTVMAVSMGTILGDSPAEVCSPIEVKSAGGSAVKFFQIYIFTDRNSTKEVLRQVEQAGYEALMLTVDTPYVGKRISEIRNRARMPRFLRAISFGSQLANDTTSASDLTIDSSLSWEEIIPWLRQNTKMQIWLKGILTAEDAALAVKYKVDGIIVSNHGGRQLDGCVPTLDALPEVAAVVKGTIPVHLDGGIRRGGDIFRAIALGADFVWVGQPVLWGLVYQGQRGVELMLEILREELKICMGLAGCTSLREVDMTRLRVAGIGVRL